MKDVRAEFLAIVFVLYSLIALLSVERNRESTSSPLISNQERISELGLRVAFQRLAMIESSYGRATNSSTLRADARMRARSVPGDRSPC
jgi:hypothetical protein